MFDRIAGTVSAAFLRLALGPWLAAWRQLPTPTDAPFAHARGVNSDRILLIGSGISVGYGTFTHELALGGELARQLSRLTGRGAYIDIVTERGMTVAGCITALEGMQLSRFDAVVTTLSWSETMRLESADTNRREMEQLLAYIEENAPDSLHVFVVAAPSIPSIVKLPWLLSRIIDANAAQLNKQARLVSRDRPNVTWLPFLPNHESFTDPDGRHSYAGWARMIAPAITAVVDREALTPRPREVVDEVGRQDALDRMDLDAQPNPALDKLVTTARDLFGVSGASITFIDRDRQWIKAAAGIDRRDIPRAEAFCDVTIKHDEVFVVPDTDADDRFGSQPWVAEDPGVRFYAGYPIESPDGHRIGTTCIVDTHPREFGEEDAALLRELALQVQTELWRTSYAVT
jgi:hypothetical protein